MSMQMSWFVCGKKSRFEVMGLFRHRNVGCWYRWTLNDVGGDANDVDNWARSLLASNYETQWRLFWAWASLDVAPGSQGLSQ